jgi:hypothetical protein
MAPLKEVGFTGTKNGLTDEQAEALTVVTRNLGYVEGELYDVTVHHGDCIGADAVFHNIAYDMGYDIVIHPPTDDSRRAFCSVNDGAIGVTWKPPLKHLVRNHKIVDAIELLIACPSTFTESLRSGTWATVREARKQGKPIIIVRPDGKVEVEND